MKGCHESSTVIGHVTRGSFHHDLETWCYTHTQQGKLGRQPQAYNIKQERVGEDHKSQGHHHKQATWGKATSGNWDKGTSGESVAWGQ